MIHIITTILLVIALAMAVLALVGVGILIHNTKSDKPVIRDYENWAEKLTSDRDEIDYHGADKLGGTDNGEDVETVYKTVYKMSDYGCEEIKDKEQENI